MVGEERAWYATSYAGRRLIDATLTPDADQGRALLIALAWLVVLAIAAAILFRRTVRPRNR